ncbi:response regulator transcription factor [Streptomyces fradiae]|uniref:response regulator transcription factor n=1 Tax=Streptomyces fradiae TaxID=1906 RepID=UPI0033F2D47E
MRILLVEDEPRIAETVQRALLSEHIEVAVESDGVKGLWAATEQDYDVMVVDTMLTGLKGYEVLQRMRSRDVWTPVLMLTAKYGEDDEAAAFDLGANDYLTKPFSLVDLVARLRVLSRCGSAARSAALVAGDLTLDPSRHRVARGRTSIVLTSYEYHVLEFLMRPKGKALDTADILSDVWDADYDGSESVIDVYIRYLRMKIDAPFGRHAIRTVRGAGYLLDSEGG